MQQAEIAIASSPPAQGARRALTPVHAVLALALLCLANTFNLADRVLVGIIQEQVRHEFSLSDFQLGLLGGPAFAVLYSLLSLPIARLADRSDRITIGALALGLWSAFTAICGLAGSYVQLFLARICVSVGEAGAAPPALSYISDIFRPERRATAMAVFAVGGPAGALFATFAGGWIAEHYGWRYSFFSFGIGGVVLAITIRLVLREVRASSASTVQPKLLTALRLLATKRSYVHVCIAGIFAGFVMNFMTQYLTSFLMRTHGLPISRAALIVGLASGVCGMAGAFAGGYLADQVARRRPGARTLVVSAGFAIGAVGFAIAFWSPLWFAIPLLMVSSLCVNSYPGVSFAVSGGVAPPELRAMAIAIFTMCGSLIGYALGPPILGAISDFAAQWELGRLGYESAQCAVGSSVPACADAQAKGLRWAMTLGALLLFGASFHHWRASKTLERDLAY